MPLIRTLRPKLLAIYLQNGAIFTGATYDEAEATARQTLIFNRELLMNSAVRGWINEKDEFTKEEHERSN